MNVVLAHGIFGFRTLARVEYFNGVKTFLEKTFRETPIRLLVSEVAPAGRIALRGTELAQQILQGFATTFFSPNDKVHLIAHSMGGLDARFCLSPGNPNNLANKVASLTTISTPHRGSPVADVLTADSVLDRLDFTLPMLSQGLRQVMEQLDFSTDGLQDLTSAATDQFNEQFPDHPDVRYFSYAGKGREGGKPTCTLLLPTHGLITLRTNQENDGMVSVDSARWGEGLVETWPADHADEIGHDLDGGPDATPASFDYLHKYQEIIERLAAL